MHITLTGSHGFIGTHLRNHLEANGHTVDCWDLLINKDVVNFTIDPKSDLCIHLAAKADIRESFTNPDLYWDENVVKCRTVFEQCQDNNIRLGIVKYATTHTRDFINVADVVSAIQTIIDNPDEQGVFECGCGIAFKVDQLVAKNGFDVPVTDGEDFELESNVLPSSGLRSLGWEPKVNVMETKLR